MPFSLTENRTNCTCQNIAWRERLRLSLFILFEEVVHIHTSTEDITHKLHRFHESTKGHLLELRDTLSTRLHRSDCISYFTYALQLSHDVSQESFCLGSYHIFNTGTVPLTTPHIRFTLSEGAPFSFHGKFVSNAATLSSKLANGWQRVNESSDKFLFDLQPIGNEVIGPGETLSFTNFQLTWSPSKTYAGSMTALFFSDQFPNGIPALNSIDINGSMRIKERP